MKGRLSLTEMTVSVLKLNSFFFLFALHIPFIFDEVT